MNGEKAAYTERRLLRLKEMNGPMPVPSVEYRKKVDSRVRDKNLDLTVLVLVIWI
jgi:hypothetical protein